MQFERESCLRRDEQMSQAAVSSRQRHAELANEIVFYSESFTSYSPVNIFQWIFNNIYDTITLGKLSGREGEYDWLILKVVGMIDSVSLPPVLLHQQHTAKRRSSNKNFLESYSNLLSKEFILTPNAAISFTFPVVKFVCCLDISRSSFAITDNGLLPISILVKTLLQTVKDIHRSMTEDSLSSVSKIFLAIIGHKPETDETYAVWSGELLLYSNIDTILADIQHRIDSVIDEAFKSIASSKNTENKRSTINTFLKAIGYHMNLLPTDACPKSILLTSGSISVSLDSSLALIAKMNYSLNIIIETISSEANILFYPDISGLQALACSSVGGGTVVVINKNDSPFIAAAIDDFVAEGLFHWYVSCNSYGTKQLYSVNPRQLVLRNINRHNAVDEKVLATYDIDCTLEHIVSTRINEGYQVVDIAYSLDDPAPIITVKMEKIVSKLSLLRYHISVSSNGKSDTGKGFRDYNFLFPYTLQLAHVDINELQGIGAKYPWKFAKNIGLRWLYGKLKVEVTIIREKALAASGKATQSHDLLVTNTLHSLRDSDIKVGQVMAKYFSLLNTPRVSSNDVTKHNVGCKYFATHIDVIDVITSFDDVLTLHFLLPSPTYIQADSFAPYLHEHVFNQISKHLSHVEIAVINQNKYLILLEEGCGKKSNLYGIKKTVSSSSQQECALLLVEYIFASNVFLTIKIKKLVSGVGQLNSLVFKLGILIHDSIKQVSCAPYLLQSDLSLFSLSPANGYCKNARNCVQGARAKSAVKNYSINGDDHKYLEYLFEEIMATKINSGFRTTYLVQQPGNSYMAVLIGVSKWNPAGYSHPSLIQCKIEISPETVSVEYYWLKNTYDKYVPVSPSASFSIASHDLDSSTHSERSSSQIERFVSMLIIQDKQIFQFYELIDLFRFHCDSNKGLFQAVNSTEFSFKDTYSYPNVPFFNWDMLMKHEIHREAVSLPCFSALSQSILSNSVLMQLLIESLHKSIASSCLFQLDDSDDVIHVQTVDNLLIVVRFSDCFSRDENSMDCAQCDLFKVNIHVIHVPTRRFNANVDLDNEAMKTLIGVTFNTAAMPSSVECMSKILVDTRQLLYHLVFNNLTRVFYHFALITLQTDPFNTMEATLSPIDVEMSIQFMHRHRVESDISVLCRRKSALISKLASYNVQSAIKSFQNTLGKSILGSEAFDIFVVNSDTTSAITMTAYDSISFVRLYLVCKVHDENNTTVIAQLNSFDKSRSLTANTFEFLVPSSPTMVCERVHNLCTLLGSSCEAVDISFLLEYISVQSRDRCQANTNTTSDTLSSDTQFRRVQSALKQFIAMDYLSTMIVSLHTPLMTNTLTADNLLLVHQCIHETTRSKKVNTNFVFVNVPSIMKKSGTAVPSSGGGTPSLSRLPVVSGLTHSSVNFEIIAESFEYELRLQLGRLGISKLGDILYLKNWYVEPHDLVPCWILITLTGNTHLDSLIASTITANITVMAFSETEDNHSLNEKITAKLINILDNCCFRTNQRHLLREIYDTRLMNPLILSLEQQPASGPNAPIQVGENELSLHMPVSNSAPNDTLNKVSTPSPTTSIIQPHAVKEPVYKAVMNIAPRVKRNPNAIVNSNENSSLHRAVNPYNELFANRQFVCQRQDEIVFSFFASSLLSYESAIRHLETSALNQLTLQNYEHYFVCQDSNAAVYYMSFDNASTSSHACIRLGIYGLTAMDKKMKEELTNILEHRLIEITAKTISAALSRNTPVSLPYLSFLKQSAISRCAQYKVNITIPAYVSDIYLLCTIVRQVFLAQVFNKLNLHAPTHTEEKKERKISANSIAISTAADGAKVSMTSTNDNPSSTESRRVLHHSEIIHPALRGYTLSSSNGAHMLHSRKVLRRKLTRSRQVDHEFHSDSTIVNPIFFGKRNIQRLPVPLSTKHHSFEEIPVIWHQNDFTFLYNWIGPIPSSNSQHKYNTKLIGQGLAIVELVPHLDANQGRLLFTGSHESLQKDIDELLPRAVPATAANASISNVSSNLRYLNAEYTLFPPLSSDAVIDGNMPSTQRSNVIDDYPDKSSAGAPLDASTHSVDEDKTNTRNQIQLFVYPTISMHTQALVDYCIACIDQAIAVYCLERVFAATSVIKDASNTLTADDTVLAVDEPLRLSASENSVLNKAVFNRYINGTYSDPNIFHSFFFPTVWKYTDYLRFMHNIISKFKLVNVGNNCVGIDTVPFKLPYKDALELHSKLVSYIQENVPTLNTNVIVSECSPVFTDVLPGSTLPTSLNKLKWLDLTTDSREKKHMLFTSSLFGEGIFSHLQQDVKDSNHAIDCKLFSDSDMITVGITTGGMSSNTKPQGKRGYFLEFVISPDGLHVFYCNISTAIVSSVYEYALSTANQIQERRIGLQQQHLHSLGLIPQVLSTDSAASSNGHVASVEVVDALSDRERLYQQLVDKLIWGNRVLSKYSAHSTQSDVDILTMLPASAWEMGSTTHSTMTFSLPSYKVFDQENGEVYFDNSNSMEAFASYRHALDAPSKGSYDLVRNPIDYSSFLVIYPIPRSKCVHVTEIKYSGDGDNEVTLCHRVSQVSVLLSSLGYVDDNSLEVTETLYDNKLIEQWQRNVLLMTLDYALCQMIHNQSKLNVYNGLAPIINFNKLLKTMSDKLPDNIYLHHKSYTYMVTSMSRYHEIITTNYVCSSFSVLRAWVDSNNWTVLGDTNDKKVTIKSNYGEILAVNLFEDGQNTELVVLLLLRVSDVHYGFVRIRGTEPSDDQDSALIFDIGLYESSHLAATLGLESYQTTLSVVNPKESVYKIRNFCKETSEVLIDNLIINHLWAKLFSSTKRSNDLLMSDINDLLHYSVITNLSFLEWLAVIIHTTFSSNMSNNNVLFNLLSTAYGDYYIRFENTFSRKASRSISTEDLPSRGNRAYSIDEDDDEKNCLDPTHQFHVIGCNNSEYACKYAVFMTTCSTCTTVINVLQSSASNKNDLPSKKLERPADDRLVVLEENFVSNLVNNLLHAVHIVCLDDSVGNDFNRTIDQNYDSMYEI